MTTDEERSSIESVGDGFLWWSKAILGIVMFVGIALIVAIPFRLYLDAKRIYRWLRRED